MRMLQRHQQVQAELECQRSAEAAQVGRTAAKREASVAKRQAKDAEENRPAYPLPMQGRTVGDGTATWDGAAARGASSNSSKEL